MPDARALPMVSPMVLRFFRGVVRRYFRRHFRAVMVQRPEMLAAVRGPLIVYANHSSWWDPMVSVLLAEQLLPSATHYAPMDAEALQRYGILRKVGVFGVEMQTARGAAQFLRTSQAILKAGGVVWITPQGRFADARAELEFKPGLGALVARVPEVTVLPLAIEYTFWDERLPEVLLRFGEPMRMSGVTADEATERLEAALAAVMAELKEAAMSRDAGRFSVVVQGGRGTGGIYAVVRRLRGMFGGGRVREDHTERVDAPGESSR